MKKQCALWAMILAVALSLCGCGEKYGGLDPQVGAIEKTEDGTYYYAANKIKVISQNVRHSNDPSPNGTEERLPRMYKMLEEYDADVMGFQEMRPWWVKQLPKFLLVDVYDSYTKYRSTDDSEGLTICWKSEKFEAVDEGVFWFSDTPQEESKYEDSRYYRIAIWVRLKELTTGQEFFVFNTHFDTTGSVRERSATLLKEQMASISGALPAFVLGDFNCTDQSEEYRILTADLTDAAAVKEDFTGTFHNYGTVAQADQKRIDYCFLQGENLLVDEYKVLNQLIEGNYCSDHFGLYMELIITS